MQVGYLIYLSSLFLVLCLRIFHAHTFIATFPPTEGERREELVADQLGHGTKED
jgi:hypothetical protein